MVTQLAEEGPCRRCRVAPATTWPFYCSTCYQALWALALESAPAPDALVRWRERPQRDVTTRRLAERLAALLEITYYGAPEDAGSALALIRRLAQEGDVILAAARRSAA